VKSPVDTIVGPGLSLSCRKVTSLADQMAKSSNPNRRTHAGKYIEASDPCKFGNSPASPPRCESVRLYGRPGRKHKFSKSKQCWPGNLVGGGRKTQAIRAEADKC
jgi:hypothetical protein